MPVSVQFHTDSEEWRQTSGGTPRGYIQPTTLKELWFHTGTICNLSCPFCLEGSRPGDDRLNRVTFDDVRPFVDEALVLGVEQFSFTGGEPFVIKDMVRILDYALRFRSCLVLTNATEPLMKRLDELESLRTRKHTLNFRISLDYPDAHRHDAGRGEGNFARALLTMGQLYERGFGVSVARQCSSNEDVVAVDRAYRSLLSGAGLPEDTRIISFPDFLPPGADGSVPEITERCMTQFHTEQSRSGFMCHFSKMVIKRRGHMKVTACTLVDDDEEYDLANSLTDSMKYRIMLKHHRCYACFSCGVSCSERV